MPWKRVREKTVFQSRFFRPGVMLFVVSAAAAAMLAPRAKRRYERWSAEQHILRAAALLEQGDHRHALLEARSALEINPLDIEAARVIARILEAAGAPEALQWRRRISSIRPGDAENLLAWARDALRAGDLVTAEQKLAALAAADRSTTAFHDVAAAIAWSRQDAAAAESHWAEACRLAPGNDDYRLNFAAVLLNSRTSAVRAAARDTLLALRAKPAKKLPAIRLLLGDALTHREGARARELADTLASDPGATFSDRLMRLSALRLLNATESSSFLMQLQASAASKPDVVSLLLAWMNQNDLAMLASDWASALPAAIVTVPPACVHLAEAYARSGEWAKLKQHAERASWRELDSLRSAWLARAHERLGEDEESAAAWKAALNDAQKHPELLERVAKLALDWRWEQRGQDALWRLANDERCPRWAIQTLWGASLKKGDSAQLCRLSRLMVRADPASVAARNNAVVLSLLTRSVETSTHEMAEALYREHPGDPVIVATYGLSLYERGRAAEALALMGALKPEQLRHPVVALYYGIFLTDAGQAEKAGEYLDIGAGGALLPEERSLLARAKANAEVIASSPKTSP